MPLPPHPSLTLPPLVLRWLWLAPLGLILMWAAYGAVSSAAIAVVQPERGPAIEAVYATGNVEPSVMLPIAARTTTRLISLQADEGDVVRRGEVLARLEDDDLHQSLMAAKAREENMRQMYSRNIKLVETGAVASQEFEASQAEWKAAIAETKRIQALVNFLTLVAPADGKVIRRDGEIGQLIPLNTAVFWLSTEAPLRISAEVDEEDIARVKVGQKVFIRADAFAEETFEGRVQQITPKGDTTARSYRVRVGLPRQTKLMIGMTAETNIVLREEKNALLIPSTALDGSDVWRVIERRLKKTSVTIGARGPERIEILQGLSDDDWIVRTPTPELQDGARVHVDKSANP